MNQETPQITSSMYCSTSGMLDLQEVTRDFDPTAKPFCWGSAEGLQQYQQPETKEREKEIMAEKTTRRIVQVFIADPNDNVPLDRSVLYTGEQKLTDLNDTELFFEVPIAETLKKHNAFRVTVADREASKRAGKDVLLDPARIRDLKMVVVTVAQF